MTGGTGLWAWRQGGKGQQRERSVTHGPRVTEDGAGVWAWRQGGEGAAEGVQCDPRAQGHRGQFLG